MRWLALFLVALGAPAQPSTHEIARTAAEAYAQGRLEDVRARFNQRMTDDMPLARLAAVRTAFLSSNGDFRGTGTPACAPADDGEICDVRLHFTRRDVIVTLAIDRDGRIASLSNSFQSGLFSALGIQPLMDAFILPVLPVLVLWFSFRFMPRVIGWDLYLTVSTGSSFSTSPEGIALLRQYRRWNSALAIAGALLAVALALANHHLLTSAGPLGQGIGMLAAHGHVRRRALAHRLPAASVRTASLSTIEPLPRWMWPVLALPVLILAAVTWYLAAHWDAIPASTPIHWGPDALPDRWETKTFKSVFGRLLIGWSMIPVLYTYTALVVWGARRNAVATRVFRAFIGVMTCIYVFGVIVPQAALSLDQPGLNPEHRLLVLLTLLPLIGGLLAVILMWRAMRGLPPDSDPTPGDCWRAGMFYVNPADPAWMVRNGIGFAPNLGHRWILVLTIVLQAQVIGAIIYAWT